MTLRRVGLSNSLSSQTKISNKRFTLSRVSLRRFPFPTAAAAAIIPNYVEEVFSTWLFTGNSGNQTITNGIDLSTKGGLVWIKHRDVAGGAADLHYLMDTARGVNSRLSTDTTQGEALNDDDFASFNTTGFSLNYSGANRFNISGLRYASWTFRKQAKFFDVVTYTGNGATNRAISHNLGSTPGCVMIKCLSSVLNTASWSVWHQGIGTNQFLTLNTTAAAATDNTQFGGSPTSTTFTVAGGGAQLRTNNSGETYVAYLFAHDAGGFGATGSDNVISCGSYVGNGSGTGPTVELGYEPQWLLIKRASGGTGNWILIDSMRGFVNSTSATPSDPYLVPNTDAAEQTWGSFTGADNAAIPLATGFQIVTSTATLNNNANTYIYIAIRRGPMKTPTSGTDVFSPNLWTGSPGSSVTTNFPVDMQINARRDSSNHYIASRLVGVLTTSSTVATGYPVLFTNLTQGEVSSANFTNNWSNIGYFQPSYGNSGANNYVSYSFRRAPGFFDVVCYTGTGSARTINHNLGAVPELMIIKSRSASGSWPVYSAALGNTGIVFLDLTVANSGPDTQWNSTTPTATVFSVGSSSEVNFSGRTYVAYLFATCPGVSKVGSYTGTGTTQVINCGFTAGARFVLIKRTNGTGDWYVYDSARGIVSGNDPYLLLNSSAAEVTNTDYIDPYSPGFEISSTAPAAINASGGTYIFLAIA